jgi:phosphoglycerate dehydrogenase-like enzyme
MNAKLGDTADPLYTRLREHEHVYATPHISGFSDVTNRIGNDMMIGNIEAWLAGKPINVFAG